ncbi:hypothetical protein IFR05_009801 [Cadophora sp. M221]|nr:hypothetical protein IFR05_009801 [Cadophora sp. M221]
MTKAKLEAFTELDTELSMIFDGHDDSLIYRQMSHYTLQVMENAPTKIEEAFGSRIVAGIPVFTIRSKLSTASPMCLNDRGVSDFANTPTASPSGSYRTEMSYEIKAASSEKLDIGFCQIASTLYLVESANSRDSTICRELVKEWLADPVKTFRSSQDINSPETRGHASWLITFDNAEQRDMLRDYWPQDGQGSILVTGRDPVVSTRTYFGGPSTGVEPLAVAEAATLLEKLVHKDVGGMSSQASADIVNRLDCFPLAISSMADVICRKSLTPWEFIHLYNKESALGELHNEAYGISTGYDHTVGSTFAIDVGFPQVPRTYFKQLAELNQSSIVVRNSNTKELSVHRLVQEVVRVKMTSTPHMFERTFDAADQWNQCGKILPHILMLKHVFSTYDLIASKELECLKELLVLFSEVAWSQLERANHESCKEIVPFALDIIDQLANDFREIAAALHGTCGQLTFDTNDPDACWLHAQQALSMSEELVAETGKTGKLATALGEMGKACNRNQLYTRALGYYSQSRALRESQEEFNKLALFTCLLGTGHSLRLLNRVEQAN